MEFTKLFGNLLALIILLVTLATVTAHVDEECHSVVRLPPNRNRFRRQCHVCVADDGLLLGRKRRAVLFTSALFARLWRRQPEGHLRFLSVLKRPSLH